MVARDRLPAEEDWRAARIRQAARPAPTSALLTQMRSEPSDPIGIKGPSPARQARHIGIDWSRANRLQELPT